MGSIAQLTEKYIRTHPYIHNALKRDLINYSKLARLIATDQGVSQFDAVLIAVRRYAREVTGKSDVGPGIKDILRESRVILRDKAAALILEPRIPEQMLLDLTKEITKKKEYVHTIRGESAITLILPEQCIHIAERYAKRHIVKKMNPLVKVTLVSSKDLEHVPGVIAFIYSLFSENGINIIETMSCWTDTIIVIDKDDLKRTIDLLDFEGNGDNFRES